jgi:hypothetical protein
MDFKDAECIRELMWVEGPLLGLYTLRGKTYLVSWVDVNVEHVWLIIEISDDDLGLYMRQEISLLEVERRSPNLYLQEGMFEKAQAAHLNFEDLPDDLRPTEDSFYDDSLSRE